MKENGRWRSIPDGMNSEEGEDKGGERGHFSGRKELSRRKLKLGGWVRDVDENSARGMSTPTNPNYENWGNNDVREHSL